MKEEESKQPWNDAGVKIFSLKRGNKGKGIGKSTESVKGCLTGSKEVGKGRWGTSVSGKEGFFFFRKGKGYWSSIK